MEKSLLFLLLFQIPSLLPITFPYTTPDKYFINCGSSYNATLANDSRIFVGDGIPGALSVFPGLSKPIEDSTNSSSPLYRTARIYDSPSSYELSIAENENGTYLLRLHFFPISSRPDLANALFNVSASGFSLLSDFAVPNGIESPVIKEFLLTINVTKFKICFIPSSRPSLAFVNAIELFLVPPDFITDKVTRVTAIGIAGSFNGLLSRVLHTTDRLNVGGKTLLPGSGDSLWRYWVPDDGYLVNPNFAKNATYFDGKLNYEEVEGFTEYIAPQRVYRTAKESNRSSYSDGDLINITWRFNVSKNATHLVRVHFCDIINLQISATFQFNLSIYGRFNEGINTYGRFYRPKSPFYVDFVVDSDDSGFFNLSIGPTRELPNATAFLNGLEIMKLSLPAQGFQKKKKTYVGAIVGSGVALISIVVLLMWFMCRKPKNPMEVELLYGRENVGDGMGERINYTSILPSIHLDLKITYAEILRATKNFDPELEIGSGGFGNVYRGTLDNGTTVAVKQHQPGNSQGLMEFEREIMILYQIRHRRLVELKGYCNEGSEMILVYEFMEMGTLTGHLYDSKGNPKCELPWKRRLEICIDSASGLNYLHTDRTIIHCDVKSANILLDNNYRAKVADFGISKLGPTDQMSMTSTATGTVGYFDPEYMETSQLTQKFDVYSFGVVLLEVLCARPPIKDSIHLAKWVKKAGQLEKFIDPFLVGKILNPKSVENFVGMAEKCLNKHGSNRPTMSQVLWDLEYAKGLEEAEMPRELHEESTTDALWEPPLPAAAKLWPSNDFSIGEDFVYSGKYHGSDTTASEVFSQLKVASPR